MLPQHLMVRFAGMLRLPHLARHLACHTLPATDMVRPALTCVGVGALGALLAAAANQRELASGAAGAAKALAKSACTREAEQCREGW